MNEFDEELMRSDPIGVLSSCIADAVRKAYEAGWNDGVVFASVSKHTKSGDESKQVSFLDSWRNYELRWKK